MHPMNAVVSEIAARQHGVVARSQLLRAGIARHRIDYRVEAGLLLPLHRGVYRCGPVAARYEREMAAVLACGERAALGYRTAAAIHDVAPPPPDPVPVAVIVPRTARGPAGVDVHRVGPLRQDELERKHGMPVTTPARTLVDLAGVFGPAELERAFARALRLRLVTPPTVRTALERRPGARGARLLRSLIGLGEVSFTRSEAEARFLTLLRQGHVERPRTNVAVLGREVDFLWPDARLIVEIDGFAHHADRAAFEDDRRRDAAFTASGFRVLRFTWRQLVAESAVVLFRVGQALGAAGAVRPR